MINYLNPAAVTARDTLSFMLDFGVSGEGKMYEQGNVKSANNIFNIYDFIFTVPIYKSSALIAGITPYSSLGYDFPMILQTRTLSQVPATSITVLTETEDCIRFFLAAESLSGTNFQ